MVVWAMLTPLATMLPAALTRLIAVAFCWAVPDRSMLEELLAVRVEPSTAMFCALAESKLTAPSTLLTTLLFLTALLLLELESVVASVIAVLVALFSAELVLWFDDELVAEFVLWLLELFDADALFDALLRLEELAFCAALAEAEFVVAFFDLEAFEAELTFELELSLDADWLALLAVAASVLALFLPELLAEALLDALALLAASLLLVDALLFNEELAALLAAAEFVDPLFLLAPWPVFHVDPALWLAALLASVVALEELLADVELLAALALLAWFAEALFVELAFAVSLLVLPLLADALSVEAADFTLLAFCALLEVEAFVVASDLFALLEAEDMSVVALLLLALAFWAALLLEVALSEELLALALLSVAEVSSLAVWFREPFRLEELVLLLVTFDEVFVVS